MFGSSVAAPPTPKQPANIDADQVSTNQQAVPVPYVLGWARGALTFISPVYNQIAKKVTSTTGKSQTSTVGYVYFGDFGAIFCCAGRRVPLAKVRRIIIDSSIAWENTAGMAIAAPYSPITVADYGAIRLYPGTPTQPQDTSVLTPIATTVPAGVDPRDTSTWPNGDETTNLP
jgi:hypothetical protein